jgi:hypothetical protein
MRFGLVIIMALISIFHSPVPTYSVDLTPALQFSATEFDFGEVAEGSNVSHEFMVNNSGPGLLKIISVQPG